MYHSENTSASVIVHLRRWHTFGVVTAFNVDVHETATWKLLWNPNLTACDWPDMHHLIKGNFRFINKPDKFTGLALADIELIDKKIMINWEPSSQDNVSYLNTIEFKNILLKHLVDDVYDLKEIEEKLIKEKQALEYKIRV